MATYVQLGAVRTWYDEHPKERHEAEAKGLWPIRK